jgi:hypothetical protein
MTRLTRGERKADRARREDGRTAIQWRKIHEKNTSKSLATKQCIKVRHLD